MATARSAFRVPGLSRVTVAILQAASGARARAPVAGLRMIAVIAAHRSTSTWAGKQREDQDLGCVWRCESGRVGRQHCCSTAGATVGTLCRLHAGFTTHWRVSVARLRVRAVVAVARSLLALLQQTQPQPKELKATQRNARVRRSPLLREA